MWRVSGRGVLCLHHAAGEELNFSRLVVVTSPGTESDGRARAGGQTPSHCVEGVRGAAKPCLFLRGNPSRLTFQWFHRSRDWPVASRARSARREQTLFRSSDREWTVSLP